MVKKTKTNELVTTAQYQSQDVNIVYEVNIEEYNSSYVYVRSINRKPKSLGEVPIMHSQLKELTRRKEYSNETIRLLSFLNNYEYNPAIFHQLRLLTNLGAASLDRFYEEKQGTFKLDRIDSTYHYTVKYILLKESSINYLESMVIKLLASLKEYFTQAPSNGQNYEEYLNNKTKELLSLDLDKWLVESNKKEEE